MRNARILDVHQPADDLMQKETEELLSQEIGRLPRHLREALAAKARVHEDGHTCRSLARALGVSPTTVTNWAAEAAHRMRPFLEGLV